MCSTGQVYGPSPLMVNRPVASEQCGPACRSSAIVEESAKGNEHTPPSGAPVPASRATPVMEPGGSTRSVGIAAASSFLAEKKSPSLIAGAALGADPLGAVAVLWMKGEHRVSTAPSSGPMTSRPSSVLQPRLNNAGPGWAWANWTHTPPAGLPVADSLTVVTNAVAARPRW